MSLILEHSQGSVYITEVGDRKRKIVVKPSEEMYIPFKECETDYPLTLIELILNVKGIDYLCDEICRDVDPKYVRYDLECDLTAYFSVEDFQGKRILDFGCGSGASSMILSRMFPGAEIVGVDLEEKYLAIAKARREHYGYANIEFYLSPSGNELPEVGSFDFAIMSAVYEHLLPGERKSVLPLIWSVIKPGGYLFLNMTPNRWFPVEHHTTGLPFINYLPESLALPFARAFSNRIDKTVSWEVLLRQGIRGATENQILKILNQSSDYGALLVEPRRKGFKDRIDMWYSRLGQEKYVFIKKGIRAALKTIRFATRQTLVPNLSLAIKKSN